MSEKVVIENFNCYPKSKIFDQKINKYQFQSRIIIIVNQEISVEQEKFKCIYTIWPKQYRSVFGLFQQFIILQWLCMAKNIPMVKMV